MYKNLKDNQINQFFFDCTYKMVPSNKNKFKLIILSGFNIVSKKKVLCLFALLTNEKKETFITLFKILKENYHFNPRNIMCDFTLGQIKALKEIYPDIQIHCCFFHFSQAICHHFKKNNLCGKRGILR